MDYLDQLNWRYATKRMNGQKVNKSKIDRIMEAIRLSASSLGLQPYSVILIENEEIRKKLQPAVFNQPQVTEGSHLLVFAVWNEISNKRIDELIELTALERKVSVESLAGYRSMVQNFVNRKDKYTIDNWNTRQAYIALGTGLMAAAMEKVDATPMEGFDGAALDKILKLDQTGLHSVVLLALGYRDSSVDKLSGMKKVRRAKDDIFETIDSLG